MAGGDNTDMKAPKKSERDIVKLIDLVPVRTIKGGNGRVVFGTESGSAPAAPAKPKNMTPRKNSKGAATSITKR